MKKAGIIILVVLGVMLVLATIGILYFNHYWFKERPQEVECTFHDREFQFSWASLKGKDYKEPHGAMIIWFKFEDDMPNLYFQFDTGSPESYLHGKTIRSLRNKLKYLNISGKGDKMFLDVLHGELGGSQITLKNVPIHADRGTEVDPFDTLQNVKIGTIGTDILNNQVSVINFIKKTISILDSKPSWLNDHHGFEPFSFKGRRIMLPVRIDNKKLTLFYDSGSSAFGLITSKYRYNKWSKSLANEYSDYFNMNGKKVYVHHKKSDSILKMGEVKLNLERVSYVDLYPNLQRYISPFTKIGGWLGNKPFLESILVIDTQKEEFLILQNSNIL